MVYKLLNFQDMKEYTISQKVIETLNKEQLILINNFKLNDNNEIIFSNLTMTKLIKEDELFYVLYRFIDDQKNFDIFKVIYSDKKYCILINKLKQLFKLEYKNNITFNIGKIIFIGNFH